MFGTLAQGFTQRVVVADQANNGSYGPTGLAFAADGSLLVANYVDGHLYRAVDGAGDIVLRDLGAVGLVSLADGRVLASRMVARDVVELNSAADGIVRSYPCELGGPVGLALDPIGGRVVVTLISEHALAWLDPASGAWTLAHSGPPLARPDGIACDADGNAYVGSVGNDRVVCLTHDGSTVEVAAIPGEPDGIAVAAPSSPLRGAVLVSCHDGALYRLDRDNGGYRLSEFARNGSRGDHMLVGPDGYLYLTQTDEVLQIGPPAFAG
jgi:outer membrane protein assembly factor BamB